MPKLNFAQLKGTSGTESGKSGEATAGRQLSLSHFFSSSAVAKPRLPASAASAVQARSTTNDGKPNASNSTSSSKEISSAPFRKRSLTSPSCDEGRDAGLITKRMKRQSERSSQYSGHLQRKLSSFKSPSSGRGIGSNSSREMRRRPGDRSSLEGTTAANDEESPSQREDCRARGADVPVNDEPPAIPPSADGDEDFTDVPSTSSTRPGATTDSEDGRGVPKGTLQFNLAKGATSRLDRARGSSSASVSPSGGMKYTPLELQFIEIKKQHPDALLFVECGYKYKFFGQDAEIAAKELNIFCHPDHNFLVASIPVHRLFVHARRLVAKGYKVGVVKQTETAALKAAGHTRGAPFQRELTALYTKSTLIGEDVDPVGECQPPDGGCNGESFSIPSNYLLCLSEFTKSEAKGSKDTKLEFGLVAVQPATGDIIYDSFYDNQHLSELDTRIHHIQPVELLLPSILTGRTEKLVQDITSSSTADDDRIRIERMDNEHFEYGKALEVISAFYGEDETPAPSNREKCKDAANQKLQEIISLPVPVICCLAALLRYLKEFQLHRVLKMTSNLVSFSSRSQCLMLDACALRNLEIFKNKTDGSSKGSLFWALDHTMTRFGTRLLRKWLAMPLINISDIKNRQDAVQEILHSKCEALHKIKQLLSRAPDLEKGLCSIYHKKCSLAEFYTVTKALSRLSDTLDSLQPLAKEQLTSELLIATFAETPSLLDGIQGFLQAVNEKAAKEGNKTQIFCDPSSFPGIVRCQQDIDDVLGQIQDHRREVRRILRKPTLEYITVSGAEFLIEVKNNLLKEVPNNWMKISFTKQVTRFHTPFLVKAYKTLSQLREQLSIECQMAWLLFLDSFGKFYFAYRKAVQHLAALDCLFSLAELALLESYCRPVFNQGGPVCIQIVKGKHPVVNLLLSEQEQYVPNDTNLDGTGQRCMIITGPNMGGKSSYIRQVALITIMAQIGSWVPAESARLGVVDAVHTRMGASDSIFQRRSTFMVELQEASEILSRATERSLVILDELGRGTSTHDGVAIAHATARHFIQEVKCLLLFVTHYPPLAELERLFPDAVANYHMGFLLRENEKGQDDGADIITFLYQLVPGVAARSYGLNVARLAELPSDIIKMAATKSRQLEEIVMATRAKRSSFKHLWACLPDTSKDTLKMIKTA